MGEATKKVVVLGAGMVGSAIARDLAADSGLRVDVADVRPEALERAAARATSLGTVRADLGNPEAVRRMVGGYDLVVGALPSVIGFQAVRAAVEAGRDCVDISFMPESALELSALACARGVTAVVDCGVAPGLSNMMAGHAAARLDPCERVEIYVGGLPVERQWPFDYKAGFAPWDVLEEYTRPARLVEHGRVVVKEPLSEPELVDVPGVGTLEAFNTDGLRTLVDTLKAPFMKEKTLRWPGHAELMRVLKATGFFSLEPLEVAGCRVRPRDLTAALLFPRWTFEEGEADLTVMRVRVEGRLGKERVAYGWDLVDHFHQATGLRSMSRTTGYVATSVARLLAAGRFRRPGVHPPEVLGAEERVLTHVLADLAARGVRCRATVTPLA
ncbi:MAG TPA: saccharopine dehydrogenase C-terminal domain-containing protein [Vicinamibacteria bacterium]|nr:saccharopine dehydrogenase C-terminal domain-containing protein [Vicinamibacteria bacterium]